MGSSTHVQLFSGQGRPETRTDRGLIHLEWGAMDFSLCLPEQEAEQLARAILTELGKTRMDDAVARPQLRMGC